MTSILRFRSCLPVMLASLVLASGGCRPRAPLTWEERTTAKLDEPWYRQHFLEAYAACGTKDPRWDSSMRQLLEEAALWSARVPQKPSDQMIKRLNEADIQGCSDPLFYYYCARFNQYRRSAARRQNYADAYLSLRSSLYGEREKFYSAWRAASELESSNPILSNRYYAEAIDHLKAALADPTILPREAARISWPIFNSIRHLKDLSLLRRAAAEILPVLIEQWPRDPDVLRSTGIAHIELAWAARGGDWAGTVTDDGWRGFAEHLDAAERAFEDSWALAPHPETAKEMLTVELGQGKGRDRFELWFQRAMQLDPANDEACGRKVRYLMPRWYGSERELFEFGWDCATNLAWKGRVPLAGVSAMENLAVEYPEDKRGAFWQRPEVWKLVRAAYERYFKLNPDDVNLRQAYVRDAYRSRAWEDLNRQLKLMECANLEYFGGEAAFNRMLEEAAEHQ